MDEANSLGINPFILYHEAGDINGTVISALVKIEGKAAEEFAKPWVGTIQ